MSMDQFKSQGGSLAGREERYDEFQGAPKNIGGATAGHTSGHHGKKVCSSWGFTWHNLPRVGY